MQLLHLTRLIHDASDLLGIKLVRNDNIISYIYMCVILKLNVKGLQCLIISLHNLQKDK